MFLTACTELQCLYKGALYLLLKYVRFYENIRRSNFYFGQKLLTEGVFVTQLSSIAGISVREIVWVATHCCFMSDVFRPSPNIKLIKTRMMELGYVACKGDMRNTCVLVMEGLGGKNYHSD